LDPKRKKKQNVENGKNDSIMKGRVFQETASVFPHPRGSASQDGDLLGLSVRGGGSVNGLVRSRREV